MCIVRYKMKQLIQILEEQEMGDVIDLWNRDRKQKSDADKVSDSEPLSKAFTDEIAKNKANKEKIEQERLQANKGVLRSYRIKS